MGKTDVSMDTHRKNRLSHYETTDMDASFASNKRKLKKGEIKTKNRRKGAKSNMACCTKDEDGKCMIF